MKEAHHVCVQFEDGTFCVLEPMHEADRVYEYYEREQARRREGVKCCWVVRPSDYKVVLGKALVTEQSNLLSQITSRARVTFSKEFGGHESPLLWTWLKRQVKICASVITGTKILLASPLCRRFLATVFECARRAPGRR
jgi:hypothetical protein